MRKMRSICGLRHSIYGYAVRYVAIATLWLNFETLSLSVKRWRYKQVKAREYRDGARTSVRNPSDTECNAEMRSIYAV